MSAFFLSTALIFLAELGDKSQLVALWFATRHRWWLVLGGVTIATLVVHLGSVAIGRAFDDLIPERALYVAVGLSFFAFAAWSIRGDSLDEESGPNGVSRSLAPWGLSPCRSSFPNWATKHNSPRSRSPATTIPSRVCGLDRHSAWSQLMPWLLGWASPPEGACHSGPSGTSRQPCSLGSAFTRSTSPSTRFVTYVAGRWPPASPALTYSARRREIFVFPAS